MLTNPALNSALGKFGSVNEGIPVLNKYISNFITAAFILGSITLFFMIILAGYEYITAGGDKESTEKAKKRLTSGLTGIVILFSVYAIIALVSLVFGLNLFTLTIPTL